jgi:hypothetical protein
MDALKRQETNQNNLEKRKTRIAEITLGEILRMQTNKRRKVRTGKSQRNDQQRNDLRLLPSRLSCSAEKRIKNRSFAREKKSTTTNSPNHEKIITELLIDILVTPKDVISLNRQHASSSS